VYAGLEAGAVAVWPTRIVDDATIQIRSAVFV
jgi:hypothetical protein